MSGPTACYNLGVGFDYTIVEVLVSTLIKCKVPIEPSRKKVF